MQVRVLEGGEWLTLHDDGTVVRTVRVEQRGIQFLVCEVGPSLVGCAESVPKRWPTPEAMGVRAAVGVVPRKECGPEVLRFSMVGDADPKTAAAVTLVGAFNHGLLDEYPPRFRVEGDGVVLTVSADFSDPDDMWTVRFDDPV